MRFRLVLKSVILNGVIALTMRYFTEFGKPAFQHITASSSIELIDQKSASVTHTAVNFVRVTKFTHSRVEWISALLTFNLSFKFCFTVVLFDVMIGFRFTVNTVIGHVSGEIYVGVYCIL